MPRSSNTSGILSLRLTPEERQLVEEAARQKGWTAAHFLRSSALEKAAHVLNLSRPTSFDFSGEAKLLAHVLLAPRDVRLVAHEGDHNLGRFREGMTFGAVDGPHDAELYSLESVGPADFQPAPLTREQIEALNQAVRLGGAEFAAELVVECRRLAGTAGDPDLPAPIDPSKLRHKEEE